MIDTLKHKHLFTSNNRLTIPKNLARFKADLSAARIQCADPPVYPAPAKAADPEAGRVKRRGRPQRYINPVVLHRLVAAGYKAHRIAKLICWPVRTLSRRLVDLGLVALGQAPFQYTKNPDGTVTRTRHVTRPEMSTLTNDELDGLLLRILADHPDIGRRMLKSALLVHGERVSKERVTESYDRAHGPSGHPWNKRTIVRQAYSVPGANSVWHMDGNHRESSLSYRP